MLPKLNDSYLLNDYTNYSSGGEYESKLPKDIAIKYARDPNSAPIFNYASMAHNNDFFFRCLSPTETTMPNALRVALEGSFSSIDTLRQEMIVTASSMFGPGFVWLVKAHQAGPRQYALLTTYLAGSPYPGAHYRKQAVDMNTESEQRVTRGPVMNTVGAFGELSRKATAPGGININPILCINTWEHVYLPDYGVGVGGSGGKRTYAERWWNRIDWNTVAGNADITVPRQPFIQ
jgi:Fe-Mn family superoxide dismutase